MGEKTEPEKHGLRGVDRYLAHQDAQAAQAAQTSPPPASQSPGSAPRAPAGWYPHPSMAATRRYWDGAQWTEHVVPDDGVQGPPASSGADDAQAVPPQPTSGVTVVSYGPDTRESRQARKAASRPTSAPGGTAAAGPLMGTPPGRSIAGRDETAYAWCIALLPLAWTAAAHFVPGAAAQTGASLVAWCLTGLLAWLDARRLRERGVEPPGWGWAVLLPPIYLIARTRAVGSTAFIPIAWFAGMAVYVVAALTFNAFWHFDGDAQGARIEQQLSRQGVTAFVTCPDAWVHDGDEVDCTAVAGRAGRRAVPLTVHIDSDGGYHWRLGE